MTTTDGMVDIVFRVGGAFVPKRVHKKKSLIVYCGGLCYWRRGVKVNKLDVPYIREAAIHGFVNFSVNVATLYSCWYREKGKTFNTGKREIVNEDEIRGLLQTVNGQGYVEVFVSSDDESVRPNIVEAQHTPKKAVVPKGKSACKSLQLRRSPRLHKTDVHESQREQSSPKPRSILPPTKNKGKGKVDTCKGLSGASGSGKDKDKGKGKLVGKELLFESDSDDDRSGSEEF
ncbi:uncharacterized protein LOC110717198 [Chenopodium quinoa]|uniref:uncharacterized protein LOC110717198 n=1 Tax=Chenopodium quinoa TaxID=63459 RepID=UPI000B794D45|nr:uncharacterized protein LOC110717198 [Chenopodium quinoa]